MLCSNMSFGKLLGPWGLSDDMVHELVLAEASASLAPSQVRGTYKTINREIPLLQSARMSVNQKTK